MSRLVETPGRTLSVVSLILGALGLALWPFAILVFPIGFPIIGACTAGIALRRRKRGDSLPIIGMAICLLAIAACVVAIVLTYVVPCTGHGCGLN